MSSFTPRFKWVCSYMGTQDFEVHDHTGVYRVETRYEASSYEHSIANHASPLFDWQRDVVGSIDLLYREFQPSEPFRKARWTRSTSGVNRSMPRRWQSFVPILKSTAQRISGAGLCGSLPLCAARAMPAEPAGSQAISPLRQPSPNNRFQPSMARARELTDANSGSVLSCSTRHLRELRMARYLNHVRTLQA